MFTGVQTENLSLQKPSAFTGWGFLAFLEVGVAGHP